MSGAVKRAFAFICSLLVAGAWAQDYTALESRLANEPRPEVKEAILRKALAPSDPLVRQLQGKSGVASVERAIRQRADAQRASAAAHDPKAQEQAKRITAAPQYFSRPSRENSNWIGKGIERIKDFFRGRPPEMGMPRASGPNLDFLVAAAWTVLGVILVVLVVMLAKFLRFKRRLKRKAGGVLDEEEPDRSLDEWLSLADRLTDEGRFREAVRALYLACLIRFDEADIARFDRRETNWEHLARISVSRKLTPGFDFRPPTKAFDRIWYGNKVEGRADCDRFRAWYHEVVAECGRTSA